MTQEKMKRTVIASVVAATLLVAVLIYQVVSISVHNKRIAKAEEEIARLQETIDRRENDLDYYLSLIGKEHLLYANGYKKGS